MFRMEKLNVVRFVATEREKAKLLKEDFKEVVKKEATKVVEEVKTKGKAK